VNGIQFPNEGETLGMDHENSSFMGYRTLFEASGIHHSKKRLKITHMYINDLFMLLYDITPDRGESEGHMSHPENGSIRLELKFNKLLPEAITCPLYLQFGPHRFCACHQDRLLKNGHHADTLYIA